MLCFLSLCKPFLMSEVPLHGSFKTSRSEGHMSCARLAPEKAFKVNFIRASHFFERGLYRGTSPITPPSPRMTLQ